jgi:hypothetical protein
VFQSSDRETARRAARSKSVRVFEAMLGGAHVAKWHSESALRGASPRTRSCSSTPRAADGAQLQPRERRRDAAPFFAAPRLAVDVLGVRAARRFEPLVLEVGFADVREVVALERRAAERGVVRRRLPVSMALDSISVIVDCCLDLGLVLLVFLIRGIVVSPSNARGRSCPSLPDEVPEEPAGELPGGS